MSMISGSLKEYFATRGKEKLKEKVKGMLIGGIELWIAQDIIPRFLKPMTYKFIDKNLKQYTPAGEKVAPALLLQMVIPEKYEESVVSDLVDIYGLVGIRELMHRLVDKEPVCIATDENTIECYNFDDFTTANPEVYIDGEKKTKGTDYTLEASKISLASPLSGGEHDLAVVQVSGEEVKVYKGKIYV